MYNVFVFLVIMQVVIAQSLLADKPVFNPFHVVWAWDRIVQFPAELYVYVWLRPDTIQILKATVESPTEISKVTLEKRTRYGRSHADNLIVPDSLKDIIIRAWIDQAIMYDLAMEPEEFEQWRSWFNKAPPEIKLWVYKMLWLKSHKPPEVILKWILKSVDNCGDEMIEGKGGFNLEKFEE